MKKIITIILSIALLCTAAVACTCGTITMQERIALYELADTVEAELAVTIGTAVYADTKGDYEVVLAIVKALYATDEELSEDTLEGIAEYLYCDCGGQTDEVVVSTTPTPQATKKATEHATATPTPTPKPCAHENVTYTDLTDSTHTKVCADCGAVLGTEEHSTEIVDNKDGTHSWVCSCCGNMVKTANCKYKYTGDVGDGWYTYTCETCGHRYHDAAYSEKINGKWSKPTSGCSCCNPNCSCNGGSESCSCGCGK